MKTYSSLLSICFILIINFSFTQANLKEYKAGHPFNISVPDYMIRTVGLNDAAVFQFKNEVKDVYGFVIEDNKEELQIADLNYSSITEFYDDFIKDFLVDEPKRTVSKPLLQKKVDINFIESELSYYDNEAEVSIYYLIGIVETKTSYYKVLSWCTSANKEKFKSDLQKVIYSIKD